MRLLVCTDGSPHSMKAVNEAASLAARCVFSEITIVYAYTVDKYLTDSMMNLGQDIIQVIKKEKRRRGNAILRKAAAVFADAGLDVHTVLLEGHPASAILDYAHKSKYDIIVVGSRGLGGLSKALLGSVSNAIVQEAKTSVLVVK